MFHILTWLLRHIVVSCRPTTLILFLNRDIQAVRRQENTLTPFQFSYLVAAANLISIEW